MTKNQIEFAKLIEMKRSNMTNERLTKERDEVNRVVSLGSLDESKRHNLATESISLDSLGETRRANIAREKETYRSNLARERETERSNVAREQETYRSNVARETEARRSNLAAERENYRSNVARESENYRSNVAREAENYRSNLARETELNRSNLARETETHRSNTTGERNQKMRVRNDYILGRSSNRVAQRNSELREREIALDETKWESQKKELNSKTTKNYVDSVATLVDMVSGGAKLLGMVE